MAAKQLRTIDSVFSRCSAIIVATDAGREGELIFRYIYSYLGYTKPFRRLWISSLTDEAIRKGLSELKEGTEYDSLYHAADCRAKADWLVGINASQALAIASGTFNQSLGRVQTPTLAMICARFKENREFVPTDYWQLSVTLKKGTISGSSAMGEYPGENGGRQSTTGSPSIRWRRLRNGAQTGFPGSSIAV
ncbi:DNA topoisomerase [Parabacteroides gordonii]|uniref:DNA topoisomerase n=1 Tax=Parabacteroides gordonii TaxID=574930 RepID=UPI00293D9335|nr:DNA topoisomerase [Parabacteroides gordonii]